MHFKRIHVQTSHQEASVFGFPGFVFQGMCKILQDLSKNDQFYIKP